MGNPCLNDNRTRCCAARDCAVFLTEQQGSGCNPPSAEEISIEEIWSEMIDRTSIAIGAEGLKLAMSGTLH